VVVDPSAEGDTAEELPEDKVERDNDREHSESLVLAASQTFTLLGGQAMKVGIPPARRVGEQVTHAELVLLVPPGVPVHVANSASWLAPRWVMLCGCRGSLARMGGVDEYDSGRRERPLVG